MGGSQVDGVSSSSGKLHLSAPSAHSRASPRPVHSCRPTSAARLSRGTQLHVPGDRGPDAGRPRTSPTQSSLPSGHSDLHEPS